MFKKRVKSARFVDMGSVFMKELFLDF